MQLPIRQPDSNNDDLLLRRYNKKSRKLKTPSLLVISVLGILLLLSIGTVIHYRSVNRQDSITYDCSDFDTSKAAQEYFLQQGGTTKKNVDSLDGDGDGIACESYTYKDFKFHFLEGAKPSSSNSDGPTFDDISNGRAYSNPACLDSKGDFDLDAAIRVQDGGQTCFSYNPY